MDYNLYLATYITYFMIVESCTQHKAIYLAERMWSDLDIEFSGAPSPQNINEYTGQQKINW